MTANCDIAGYVWHETCSASYPCRVHSTDNLAVCVPKDAVECDPQTYIGWCEGNDPEERDDQAHRHRGL